jgi:hypothetical protein
MRATKNLYRRARVARMAASYIEDREQGSLLQNAGRPHGDLLHWRSRARLAPTCHKKAPLLTGLFHNLGPDWSGLN